MLVGVDGTEGSSAALRWAASHTDRFGGIVPATAWRYPGWAVARPPQGSTIAWPESDFVRHAKHRAAAALRGANVAPAAEHLVKEQSAGPMLVANSRGAELLVVGTRRRGRGAAALLGTVSGHCIARAPVPVAVVPPNWRALSHGRVIVGLDESPEALAALAWAIANTPRGHQVHVIHTWSPGGETAPWFQRMLGTARAQANKEDSPFVTGQISFGPPAAALRLASASADMLVVGTRGRGPIAHAIVGSVTSSLCRDPATATVVVPVT